MADIDIRTFLKRELLERQKRNPKYSMRAFAASLGLNYSFLSKVLEGKNLLSSSMLEKISGRLELDESTLEKLKKTLAKERQKRRQKLWLKKPNRYVQL